MNACAVGGDEFLNVKLFEGLDGFCDALRACVCKVHTADEGADRTVLGEFANVKQNIDNACMGTSEKNNNSFKRIKEKRLVVKERIGYAAISIQEKCSASIFEFCDSWNFACGKDAGDDFRRRSHQSQTFSKVFFSVGIKKWNADFFDLAVFVFQKFFLERGRMQKNRRAGLFHGKFESADVIVMSVTQDDGICLG